MGKELRDLAISVDYLFELPGKFRQRASNQGRPYQRWLVGRRYRSHHARHHLDPGSESDRSGVGRESVLSAEDFGRHHSGGGATDVKQHAPVIGLPCCLLINTQTCGKPHRNQRAVEAMFQRHADGQVGRQR
jgi:hypothetical protein